MGLRANVVFCDDIRQEASGKILLIGVYANGVRPAQIPTTLTLALWVCIEGLPGGKSDFAIDIGTQDRLMHHAEVNVEVHAPSRPANLFIHGIPITLEAPGEVRVELSGFASGETIRQRLVVDPPAPTVTTRTDPPENAD